MTAIYKKTWTGNSLPIFKVVPLAKAILLLCGFGLLSSTALSQVPDTRLSAPTFQSQQPSLSNGSKVTSNLGFTDPANVDQDLARIDSALNSTQSFYGRFQQYGADGSVSAGQIYLSRPGRMRFEYESPSQLLIVSDGTSLIQHDAALETTDRVPLGATPLNYFLKNDVNLARDTEVVGLIKNPSDIRVTAKDGSGELDGLITMVFAPRDLRLLGWEIADSFGGVTRVVLSELTYNSNLDPRLFIFREDNRRDRDFR